MITDRKWSLAETIGKLSELPNPDWKIIENLRKELTEIQQQERGGQIVLTLTYEKE